MRITDILRDKKLDVKTINQERTIHAAIKILVEYNIGALPVLDDKGKMVGIISERDILRECAQREQLLKKTRVKDVMTKKMITGFPDDEIEDSLSVMTKHRIRHLPIVSQEQLVGIISLGDAVKAQLDEKEIDNQYLKQYMFGT